MKTPTIPRPLFQGLPTEQFNAFKTREEVAFAAGRAAEAAAPYETKNEAFYAAYYAAYAAFDKGGA